MHADLSLNDGKNIIPPIRCIDRHLIVALCHPPLSSLSKSPPSCFLRLLSTQHAQLNLPCSSIIVIQHLPCVFGCANVNMDQTCLAASSSF